MKFPTPLPHAQGKGLLNENDNHYRCHHTRAYGKEMELIDNENHSQPNYALFYPRKHRVLAGKGKENTNICLLQSLKVPICRVFCASKSKALGFSKAEGAYGKRFS